jgi:acetyl/propionyl-CoA carboxylase alpha subunit
MTTKHSIFGRSQIYIVEISGVYYFMAVVTSYEIEELVTTLVTGRVP